MLDGDLLYINKGLGTWLNLFPLKNDLGILVEMIKARKRQNIHQILSLYQVTQSINDLI